MPLHTERRLEELLVIELAGTTMCDMDPQARRGLAREIVGLLAVETHGSRHKGTKNSSFPSTQAGATETQ